MARGKRERRRAVERDASPVTAPAAGSGPRPPRRAIVLTIGGTLAALVIATGAGVWWWLGGARPQGASGPPATYVGQPVCGQCHQQAEKRWRGSHHDLAMQLPTEASVAGNFADARFTYARVTSTFSRRDGKYVVRTDGPDGRLQDYVIKYTFGISPLQQYLIELPGGRLQALGIAWDSRPKGQGGQRWFHLYPGQNVTHRDPLHWTGLSQNWNYMCAECHSTGVRKNYDPGTGRFATTYAEVNVACEACHGPGSNHVAWARGGRDGARRNDATKGLAVVLDDRRGVTWAISPETGNAQRSTPGGTAREVEVCGRCHARRGQFSEEVGHGQPLGDTHRVALLEDRLYHPDGQIRDEVYEYGSFLQSKMFNRGVTCSDCHDPHSGKLRASGSQVCLGCHAAPKYATATHHFHPTASRGADCLGCHMPTTTYMVVDQRHDHSFRVPRPDLSVALGVPNACTKCHADRPAAWAARQVETWYGRVPRGYQRHAEAFAVSERGAPGATGLLEAVFRDGDQSAIARASALARLGAGAAGPAVVDVARSGAKDKDPLVRRAAAAALEGIEPAARVEILAPLLDDPVRGVRMEAARALAGAPRERLTEKQRGALDHGLAEYVAAERFDADRPESHLNLAGLYAAQRRTAEAEAALQAALRVDPRFVPASVNLADLYRAAGREAEGERVLRDALERDPGSAAAQHALGLLLVRQQRMAEAMPALAAAARLAPESARYGYVYAVGLHGAGRRREAVEALERVLDRHPYDRETLAALIAYAQEQGAPRRALPYARRLAELEPAHPELRQLVRRLEAESPR
ncbi:MAG TPA: tetratricopeptide repeat protein [Methylomirabilota bacterium]|nr:tetratricopeptide repeat protein [Methylomirabilota bacterium]